MTLFSYQAKELFDWLVNRQDMVVLDVRNDKDFKRFSVESPYPFDMQNVSYYDFMELEEESVAKVPRDKPVRIVCAKEGSAKYVGEILAKHGFEDVGYLTGGIRTWGNLLVPMRIHGGDSWELYQFIRPGKASCSYGLLCGNEIMLFDPSRNTEFYLEFARAKNSYIVKTFETHLQADYIAGSRMIAAETGAQFLANDRDFESSHNNYQSLVDHGRYGFSTTTSPEVEVLFTPGHTPGSTSYIVDDKFMISGDTVFIDSVGRPDLGGKAEDWAKLLYATLQQVKQLSPEMLVLPGHYINWQEADQNLKFEATLGDVLAKNSAIYNLASEKEFIGFIKENMREQPPEYATIRLVNANLEQYDDEQLETLDLGKNECAASAYAKAHGG